MQTVESELQLAYAALAAAQTRCTELIEEARAARAELRDVRAMVEVLSDVCVTQHLALARIRALFAEAQARRAAGGANGGN